MTDTFSAFTLSGNGILNNLTLQVGVLKIGSVKNGLITQKPMNFNAIWSTGAKVSCISSNVVKAMSLKANEDNSANYLVDFLLPNNIHFNAVNAKFMQANPANDYDIIIGMEIISKGDMTLTNKNGKTVFSFRVPSIGADDFVKLHRQMQKPAKLSIVGVQHHQMCPCGSGKKYKNCCEKRK